MKKRIVILLAIMVIAGSNAEALFNSTYWGVRPLGMGGAFTAVADDASAILYNIAGTAWMEKAEIVLTSAKLFTGMEGVDMGIEYIGMVYPISEKWGSVSVAWSLFGNTGLSREDTINIGYARSLNDLGIWEKMDISVGVVGKYVRQEVDFGESEGGGGKEGRDGVTVDMGILARFEYGISAGISSKYMTRPDVGFSINDKIPSMNVIGLGYYNEELPVIRIPKFTIAADYEMRSGDENRLKIGMESKVIEGRLALRLGGWSEMINIGAGYEIEFGEAEIKIDYTFALPIEIQENTGSHFLSLSFVFP
jgi:hypothetical protein